MWADVVLRGAAVYTFDAARPRAQALAIKDGRILALGEAGDLGELIGSSTRVVDLAGSALVPGFVDAHIHFGSFALGRQQVDLDSAATLEDGLAVVRAFVANVPADGWVRGRGWDRNRWGRLPTARELDQAIGDRPAALSSHDGHSLWLSSAALAAVGLTADTPTPPGGVIERDAQGQPSGVVFETAQDAVRRRLPVASDVELTEAIRRALPLAAAAGVTGMHNFEDEHSLAAFQALEEAGELTMRVYHGVRRGQLRQAHELGVWTGRGSEWVRIGPVKLFSDGALGSRTAHLLEPYEGVADGYRGVATLQPDELVADMCLASAAGLDVAVHAIGDAAVRSVLDAVERARQQAPAFAQRRVRIEHAQMVHPDDVPRFAELGVIASMQPIHAIADWRVADTHWGTRARYSYAWHSLLAAGARLACGTDAPVERMAPLANLYAATTRLDPQGEPGGGWYPEQRLSLTEAVAAYTSGSADAEGALARRGSLAPGKDADLVALRPDPFPLETAALLDTRVVLTVVGGRVVFES